MQLRKEICEADLETQWVKALAAKIYLSSDQGPTWLREKTDSLKLFSDRRGSAAVPSTHASRAVLLFSYVGVGLIHLSWVLVHVSPHLICCRFW